MSAPLNGSRALVAASNRVTRRAIKRGLLDAGCAGSTLGGNEAEVLRALEHEPVAILDARVPWLDVVRVIEKARKQGSRCYVLVLGLPESELARVDVLDAGADDCVSLPHTQAAVRRRAHDIVRRSYRVTPKPRGFDPLSIGLFLQPQGRAVVYGDRRVDLSLREYAVLDLLAAHPGQIVSREQLVYVAWDRAAIVPKAVDVTVGRLRRKLSNLDAPVHIAAANGHGFILEAAFM